MFGVKNRGEPGNNACLSCALGASLAALYGTAGFPLRVELGSGRLPGPGRRQNWQPGQHGPAPSFDRASTRDFSLVEDLARHRKHGRRSVRPCSLWHEHVRVGLVGPATLKERTVPTMRFQSPPAPSISPCFYSRLPRDGCREAHTLCKSSPCRYRLCQPGGTSSRIMATRHWRSIVHHLQSQLPCQAHSPSLSIRRRSAPRNQYFWQPLTSAVFRQCTLNFRGPVTSGFCPTVEHLLYCTFNLVFWQLFSEMH